MLTLIPNEEKTAIQFLFNDFFTKKKQFVTAFELNDAEQIAKDLMKMVKETRKKENNYG